MRFYNVLDLETTGLNPYSDCIVEVGILMVRNGVVFKQYQQLVHPSKSIPSEVTAINHITNEMVADQPEVGEVMQTVYDMLRGYPIVGHNIGFDMSFLMATGVDFTLKGKRKGFDTLTFAREKYPYMRHRLGDMAEHFHIIADKSHTALGDCQTTYLLFEAYQREFGDLSPLDIFKRQEASNDKVLPFE